MIKIIQGDSKNLTITVTKGAELIEQFWLSSKELGICQMLPKINDNQYLATFKAADTRNFKVCRATYDITAILKDDQVDTVVYEDEIRILEKENVIDGN